MSLNIPIPVAINNSPPSPVLSKSSNKVSSSSLNSDFIQKLPELKFDPSHAFINEPFLTRIEIPQELKNPQIMMLSPILGPVDIEKSGLVEVKYRTQGNSRSTERKKTKIEIRSLKTIPASINLGGRAITTAFNFPIIIFDQGKPVAKSSIEISARKLKPEEQNFMQNLETSFAKGSFTTSYPIGSAQPYIKIHYNKAPQFGKLQAGIKELWKLCTTGKGTDLLENWFNTENKSPEQRRQDCDSSTDYLNIEILDEKGQIKSRFNSWGDYLGIPNRWGAGIYMRAWDGGYDSGSIGGRAGPIFNSASEFVTYVLNNFAFAGQEQFAPQFTAQKPNLSMSKERECKSSKKVTASPATLSA